MGALPTGLSLDVDSGLIDGKPNDDDGRYLVSIGPTSLVNGSGKRFQASTAKCSFGFEGLISGIRLPLSNTY